MSNSSHKAILFPVWGVILYIALYFLAASLYPGGSDQDHFSKGFSWQHNYWCELMASTAMNGEPNTASTVAIVAMFVLAISLGTFWYWIPHLFPTKKTGTKFMRIAGIGSMVALPLFFTGNHDLTINIAGALGCLAIMLLLINLYGYRHFFLFCMGICCLLLCALNNYIYYYRISWMYYLPVIQKITFVVFLSWFVSLSFATKKNYLHAS